MTAFGPETVAAVLDHMNADHRDDSLAIVQGHAIRRATSATMTGLDAEGGDWDALVDGVPVPVRIPWTERAVERADLRREIVRLHDTARERLGTD